MAICPLTQVPIGERCRIKKILADPKVVFRLQELGFIENADVKVITKAYICEICQARFGLCPELAAQIMVEK